MFDTPFYNSHHSPIGAFASFTLGARGAKGGLGLELSGPADRAIYIGVERRDEAGSFQALPFYDFIDAKTEAEDYDVEGLADFVRAGAIEPFPDGEIKRHTGASVDEWRAGDLLCRIVSPVMPVPDPDHTEESYVREAIVPAVTMELTIDNRGCSKWRKAFFGFSGNNPVHAMRVIQEPKLTGIGQGLTTAIGTSDPDVYAGLGFQPEAVLLPRHESNLNFMLGTVGLLVGRVPPGAVKTFRFAIGFFREGAATTGITTRYLYRRMFESVEEVLRFALARAESSLQRGLEVDARLSSKLSPERWLMLAQAIRSYYGSTQLLMRSNGKPIWVVNEGEYRMMNTFDLVVDQAFFELALNPWTVRNELDLYVERYSYDDRVRLPGEEETHPGGITFTHDMGVANCFAPRGRSCYEQAGLRGCFSYMSAEELLNWVICGCLYVKHTGDLDWLRRTRKTFEGAIQSLVNRDHPNPDSRNGVVGLDGARCEGGAEITTYDSLDASLGQARNNLYLAVKTWAAYVLLEPVFEQLGRTDLRCLAADQAARCASTVVGSVESNGLLPAVIGEGIAARIIPAIEALVYPWITGQAEAISYDGQFGDMCRVLTRHFDSVLSSGACRFADGGWRLSSTSRNSWLSKIYLCQAVAEKVLGKDKDLVADRAHLGWLMRPDNGYYAWSDQMLEGKAVGSRYYPRGVTAALWLCGTDRSPIDSIADILMGEGALV